MIADLEYLTSTRIDTAEVQIGEQSDGTPIVVKVRGMTRQEMLDVPASEGPKVSERWSLARCMVEPELTEDQVAAWQKAAPAAEVESVARAVNRLSGIENGQLKERYKSLGG
jgi:hypothetical protein